jgi:hypothetical protein
VECRRHDYHPARTRNPNIGVEIVPGAGGATPEEKRAVMVAAGVPPDLVRSEEYDIQRCGGYEV